MSAALYVLAINPWKIYIKADTSSSGTRTRSGEQVVSLAYSDNVAVIVKNQNELNQVNEYLKIYEQVQPNWTIPNSVPEQDWPTCSRMLCWTPYFILEDSISLDLVVVWSVFSFPHDLFSFVFEITSFKKTVLPCEFPIFLWFFFFSLSHVKDRKDFNR